jgi:uncharacterized protein (DUF362 family)
LGGAAAGWTRAGRGLAWIGTPAIEAPVAGAPVLPVALRSCKRYGADLVYARLSTMFADLGGVGGLVSGRSVAIKINGVGWDRPQHSLPPIMAHASHPDVAYAVCRLLLEAGATRLYLMDSWPTLLSGREVAAAMDYDVAAFEALGDGSQVRFFSTRNKELDEPNPDSGFAAYELLRVADGVGFGPPYLFDSFYVNRLWAPPKAEVVVSIAKLKGHYDAGVTLTTKNIFGCIPNSIYGGDAADPRPNEDAVKNRLDSCHLGAWNDGEVEPAPGEIAGAGVLPYAPHRIPYLLADLVRALPIDLAIVDGITGSQGAWGPTSSSSVTTPGVLLAGFNPICTDAVAMGVMGQDPRAAAGSGMFLSGLNHLALAAARGVGSNDLARIPVLGETLAAVRYDYSPAVRQTPAADGAPRHGAGTSKGYPARSSVATQRRGGAA